MTSCAILSLVPAPVTALALFAMLKYKYPKGKFGLVYKSFLFGALGIIAVFAFDKLVGAFGLDSLHSWNRTFFYAFILTAGFYEFWKFLVLRVFIYPSDLVVKPIDSIIYSVFTAAGFMSFFAIYSLFYGPSYINSCFFAITLGPAFISLAVIMGYFMGMAKSRQNQFVDLTTGLFITIIFHGIYRFCILTFDRPLMCISLGGMVIIALTFLWFAVKRTD